jgi:hypothetical protein
MQVRQIWKWLLYVAIGSVAMYFFVNFLFSRDPHIDEVEKFLRSNPAIQAQIGNVQSLKMNWVTSVQATEREPAYRLYNFYAKGESSDARVVVRAEKTTNQNIMKFSITSMKRESS